MPRKTDDDWERELVEFICGIGLTSFRTNHQVPYNRIDPRETRRKTLEFDSLTVAGTTCLVGDITDLARADDINGKYRRWTDNYDFFRQVATPNKFDPFPGIDRSALPLFAATTDHRAFLVLTSPRVRRDEVRARRDATILGRADWDILQLYRKSIGHWARYPFLSKLGIPNDEIPTPTIVAPRQFIKVRSRDFIQVPSRLIGRSFPRCNLIAFTLDPEYLLQVSEVFRDDRIPSVRSDPPPPLGKTYQRILIPEKINALKDLVSRTSDFSFPNSVIAVLHNCCTVGHDRDGDYVKIPCSYGALEIVDGQHRLFSYAHQDVSPSIRHNARIMVLGLQFPQSSSSVIRRSAAKVFFDINMNHTRIKRVHLWRVGFHLLGMVDASSLAFVALERSNQAGVLKNVFMLHPTDRGNPVRVETLVPEVAAIFEKLDDDVFSRNCAAVAGVNLSTLVHGEAANTYEGRIRCVQKAIDVYFRRVRSVLGKDWRLRDAQKSHLWSTNYFAALIRLLVMWLGQTRSRDRLGRNLRRVFTNVGQYLGVDRRRQPLLSVSAPPNKLPIKKSGVPTITTYLRGAATTPHRLGRFLKKR